MSKEAVASGQVGFGSAEENTSGNSRHDAVSAETHRRLLGQHKKAQSELNELRSSLEETQLNIQKAEGQKDEVITTLEKKNRDLEQQLIGTVQAFTERTIKDEIVKSALAKGIQSEKIPKFLKLTQDDFLKSPEIQIDSSEFRVQDKTAFDRILDEHAKDNSDWFTTSVAAPRDLMPSSKPMNSPTKKLSDMDVDELANML